MRWASKWPFNPSGEQLAAMLLYPTLAVGLGYYIFFWRPASGEPRPGAAGWEDLALCSELSSFDGEKSLTLHNDGRADLIERTSADNFTKTEGAWKLRDGAGNVYEIDASGATGAYTLVAPQDPKDCMLAAGEPDHPDLHRSWFPSDAFDEPIDDDTPDTSP